MTRQIATVISRVLDPLIVLAAWLILVFARGGETSVETWVISFLLTVGVPVILILIALGTHVISNWDISDRKERPRVLGVLLLVEGINLFLLQTVLSAETHQALIYLFLLMLGFTLITLFWKISGHAMASGVLSGFLILWFGWGWWPMLCIVPLVGWARVVRRDHTVGQVIAGAAYAWVFIRIIALNT